MKENGHRLTYLYILLRKNYKKIYDELKLFRRIGSYTLNIPRSLLIKK